ncbi:MAG TPA: FkbM family methyltransferase [Halococcus sp.]|nr:FkbM family methyltransferase [Halococcus sp.]
MNRDHRQTTQRETNPARSMRQHSSERDQPPTRDRLLNAAARLADRYGVSSFVSAAYWKLDMVYCLARIAAVGGEWNARVGDATARFGLSTRSEYRRAMTLGGERAVIEALLAELDGTETVWDVGACVGTYTCFIANALTTGHVIGFEPETTNRSRLRMNLETNASTERFSVSPIALSAENGKETLVSEYIEAGGGHHSLTTDELGPQVETRRGDSLVERGFTPPEVLKIDVQGAELAVLCGLEGVLGGIDSIYLEVHPEKCVRYGTTSEEVETFLRKAGYSLTHLGTPTNRRSGVYFVHAGR